MHLADDDFTLFGLPQRFALDRAALDDCWRALQAQVHPDRFASEGASAQRLADARNLAAVETLDAAVATDEAARLAELGVSLDERADPSAAAQQVRALMFVDRFRKDIGRRLEALDA